MAAESLFPEDRERIASILRSEVPQDLVVLIVPSHDKNEKKLKDQDQWAATALETITDLFGGGTSFQALAGAYKDGDKILHDKPILVESYVQRADLENEEKVIELLKFVKRMGKATKQAAVAIIINNVFHLIHDFKMPS